MVGPCFFYGFFGSGAVSLFQQRHPARIAFEPGKHGKRRKAAYSATQQLGHPRVQKLLPVLSCCLKSHWSFEGKCAQTESRTARASVDLWTSQSGSIAKNVGRRA